MTDDNGTVRVGKDGAFTCYLDSGNGYGYQEGDYAAVRVSWKEEGRELAIGAAEGSYPCPARWTVTLYTRQGSSVREAEYRGEETSVSFRQ